MTALRLFSYKTEAGGVGEAFDVGEYPNIVSRMTEDYVDASKFNGVLNGIQITSFILTNGYGATFYKGANYRNSSRTILAGKGNISNTFTGDDRYDRTLRSMKFAKSSDTMVHNIRSVKVFALPTKSYCSRPKISDRDLCSNAYGANILKSLADVNVTPTITEFPGGVTADDDYVIQPTGMTEAESIAWMAQHSGTAQDSKNMQIGLGIFAAIAIGYMFMPSNKRRRR